MKARVRISPSRSASSCSSANSCAVSSTRAPRPLHAPLHQVEFEIGDPQRGCPDVSRAPEQRADSREQFRIREGFGQVVVGAELEPLDLVGNRVASGEQQHRRRLALPKAAQHFEPVDDRQHHVEDQQVEVLFERHEQAVLAVAGDRDAITGLGQSPLQVGPHFFFVFDNQDAHGGQRLGQGSDAANDNAKSDDAPRFAEDEKTVIWEPSGSRRSLLNLLDRPYPAGPRRYRRRGVPSESRRSDDPRQCIRIWEDEIL